MLADSYHTQLSPFSRYYLRKLFQPTIGWDAVESALDRLCRSEGSHWGAVNELQRLVDLHQELSRRGKAFEAQTLNLEQQVLALLGFTAQNSFSLS